MMSACKKRKTPQSQTQFPNKIPFQNHHHKSEDQNPITEVPYLPSSLVFEILSRVCIKTLFNCRLVCKIWAELISTPEFTQLHLSRSPTSCLISPLTNELYDTLQLFVPENPCTPKLTFVSDINLPTAPLYPANTCNGLICLLPQSYHDSSNLYVCNPVLKEYITIPIPSYVEDIDYCCCAVGFSYKTNEYKVILISYNTKTSPNYKAEIYTLGEGLWRSIAVNAPSHIQAQIAYWYNWNKNFNAYVDGSLHWITTGSPHSLISCFDFVTEQFRSVPEPSEFHPLEEEYFLSINMYLGVIDGNLSLCDNRMCDRTDIWVMKDYGVKESWNKHIVINHIHMINTNNKSYESIVITGSGEVLVTFENDSIMLYDPKSQVFKCEIVNSWFGPTVIAYVPSLISLIDVAKGENLKVLGEANEASMFCGNKEE